MNLQTAHKELHSRSPRVTGSLLVAETLVVVLVSYALVGLFS